MSVFSNTKSGTNTSPLITKRFSRRNLSMQLEHQSMVIPGIIFLIVFAYLPMYGLIIAFREFDLIAGFFEGEWVGFKYFEEFLGGDMFPKILRNTIGINLLGLAIGFPAPIILALLLNEITSMKFKRFVQTVSYLPHFVSWVIYGGIMIDLLSPVGGAFNSLLTILGIIDRPIHFLAEPEYFWPVFVISSMLKGVGFGAVIYIASIAGINQELYEAATIDGAGRFQKMKYVTLPGITGTIVIMMIFTISGLLGVGFEQAYLLQNPLNIEMSEVISTYVYKVGIQQMRFSYSAAVGVFNSVVALLLLLGANYMSKRLTDKGLF